MSIKIKADPVALREDLPHILSLGAGVQSSTLALMAAKGLVSPMPVAAIFADVKAEPESVYTWLAWLEKQLPFPVHRATWRKGLAVESLKIKTTKKDGRQYWNSKIPFFTLSATGSKGMLKRKCTVDFKIDPLMREAKKIIGIKRASPFVSLVSWIGISIDELSRMKASPFKYAANRWPLLELGMSRRDCLEWMKDNGFPKPPRSACYFCPYHSNVEWQRLKTEEPKEFAKAVKFEKASQRAKEKDEWMNDTPFLHSSCKPLDEIDFTNPDPDQEKFGFINECEGMCGN